MKQLFPISIRTKVFEMLHSGDHKAFEKIVLREFATKDTYYSPPLDVCIYQQAPYTHAILTFYITTPDGKTSHGYAKCNPGDEWDSYLGKHIAVVRAARNLFRELQQELVEMN